MPVANCTVFIIVICVAGIAPLVIQCAETTWKRKIVVSQQDGNDSAACLYRSIPCRTLDYALQHVTNSTLVEIQSANFSYSLTHNFTFTNIHGFGLVGDLEAGLITVKCGSRGSLSFVNSEDINIRRISFDGCGGLHASTTGDEFKYPHIQFLSAVFFVYCKNIVIDNCWIVNSPGIGLNMYDVGGEVTISNSRFENNRPNQSAIVKDVAIAGGGVYIELTYRGGSYPFDLNSSTLAQYDSNSSYTFYNCTFKSNYAPDQKYETIVEHPFDDDHIPFGRGGGLSVFLRGKAENNIFLINLCYFEDNHAAWGGGAFIEFHDIVQNNTLEVTNCIFNNNSADLAGGGFRSGTTAKTDKRWLLANKMKYENCTFESNHAILGGGVAYYEFSSPLKENDGRLFIEYKNCTWKKNTATLGSAFAAATDPSINGLQFKTAEGSKYYSILFEDCSFSNNLIVLTEDKEVIGQGAIYSYSLPIIFKGTVIIKFNNNTAMVIENAVLHVFDNVTFRNNEGGQGGALGLYGTSLIMLMPHSQLTFINNTARERGGALYAKDSGPPVVAFNTTELRTRRCFVAYNNSLSLDKINEWQTKMVFQGNEVLTSGGGVSVFASTLQGCRQDGEPRINAETFEWPNITEYQDTDNSSLSRHISTDAVLINFNESEWDVSPGEVFDAKVELIDEKNSLVLGVVKVIIIDEGDQNTAGSVKLGTASDLFLVQGDSANIGNLSLKGTVGRSFSVHIRTIDGRVVHTHSKRKLTLRPCSPGFKQNTDSKTCSCISSKIEPGISNCSADSKSVFLKRGYWGGMISKHEFSTYPCPPDYCSDITQQSAFKYSPETMCTAGRNGSSILCGACKDNYSVNLGNEKCRKDCSNKYLWLGFGFFVIIPILVLVVFRIDLDIFTTYLNTWLYSYQIILFLLEEGQHLDKFISFIISLANWRVEGVGTCLFSGMNNLEKLGVNYILPAYVLFLLFILAKIARRRPSCYINRNVANAFCTLLVLCYTNVTTISFNIVHYVSIHGRWVLYADGNIDFTRDWREHLPFTIIACLWIVFFVFLVPLLLLFTPWFIKHFPYLRNFRLFFDMFQRCFKIQYRWFAAYYFICRICILLIALFWPLGPLKRSILEVTSIFIVVICLYLQPYNEQYQWFNRLDAVLLTNLCLVANFSSTYAPQSVPDGLEIAVNVLAYVPLVYLIILVGYHGWRYCCPNNYADYNPVDEDIPSISETAAQNHPV